MTKRPEPRVGTRDVVVVGGGPGGLAAAAAAARAGAGVLLVEAASDFGQPVRTTGGSCSMAARCRVYTGALSPHKNETSLLH